MISTDVKFTAFFLSFKVSVSSKLMARSCRKPSAVGSEIQGFALTLPTRPQRARQLLGSPLHHEFSNIALQPVNEMHKDQGPQRPYH